MLHAYCLFCQTQKCRVVASILEERLDVRAFAPQIYKRQRIQGRNVDKLYDLLPGYVFVISEKPLGSTAFYKGIDGIIRRIGNPEDQYELVGSDAEFAINLYEKNGIVGQIKVYQVGDTVRIDDPLFNGSSGRISRIDTRKQRARIEYQFAGMNCFTWIACDLIREAPKNEV